MKTVLFCLVSIISLAGVNGGESNDNKLVKNFYAETCPEAEDIIRKATEEHVAINPELPAKLLRMHFRDCFVRGCDGSILINSTANNSAEKGACPNGSLSGFDVIEEIKAELETKCPEIVSCADILALATRDSVSFQYKRSLWEVMTGRRDGRTSVGAEVSANLPSPFQNFTTLSQKFIEKGLSVRDLVVLSGAHTIGVGHCNLFSGRLYSPDGQDPSLDPAYAEFLKTKCRNLTDIITTVEMDPGSGHDFNSDYYVSLNHHKGLFQSDAALLTDDDAREITMQMTDLNKFLTAFSESMMRMGAIEVLTGTEGEIRKTCAVIN